MEKVLVIHGLNHDTMGKGANTVHAVTMESLNEVMLAKAATLDLAVDFYQNNDYTAVAAKISAAKAEGYEGIVFNPAQWMEMETEGRVIAAALKDAGIPTIEIHISNICKAETLYNVIAPAVTALVAGVGEAVYPAALQMLVDCF